MATKARLDQLLVDRGLAESRERAKALILAGEVTVNGQRSDKPGHTIAADARVDVAARPPYVSRGGFKLAAALDHWRIDPVGRICFDAGASTGGFTDCLLQRGAAKVYAFDVGTAQLDWKIRSDARVVAREGINLRHLTRADVPDAISLAVCDVSFISATLILPTLAAILEPAGEMVVLVKPQFEAGRGQVGKGGIVKDPALHAAACQRVREAAVALGFARTDLMESPILGAEGNREFLLYAAH
ncbi:MAG: TlyA family RNA methyltransferase [Bryobacterales bacterium]|nr:TlyA family RNA methyltransferase [Bryobacterales bacterium]